MVYVIASAGTLGNSTSSSDRKARHTSGGNLVLTLLADASQKGGVFCDPCTTVLILYPSDTLPRSLTTVF